MLTEKVVDIEIGKQRDAISTTALRQLKVRVKDMALPTFAEDDDAFLIRWLIARDFNVDKAFTMLENYLVWRKENEIDKILEWVPPEDMKKACPYEISFQDREGRPVLLFPWGRWTPWEFTDKGRKEEYIKYMNQMLEKCIAAIVKPATQFVILADSDGFSFRHMARVKALEANLEAIRGFESHYPEMMSLAFAVNCPKVFSLLFTIIRPLMSSRTQEKLRVHDSSKDKWIPSLYQYISPIELPENYGGHRKSIGSILGNQYNDHKDHVVEVDTFTDKLKKSIN